MAQAAGPRHQLHRARRRARALRPRRAASRRRRSTSSATSAAAACSWRSASCAASSRRSARARARCIDVAMVDGSAILMSMMWGFRSRSASGTRQLGVNVLDTGAPFYDTYETRRRQVHLARLARAAVLRRADPEARARGRGPARADGPHRLGRAARRGSPSCSRRRRATSGDADPRGQRRVLRAGAHDDARRRTTSTSRRARRSSSATACRSRRRRRASRAPRPRCSARRPWPGQHTDEALRRLGLRRGRRSRSCARPARSPDRRGTRVSRRSTRDERLHARRGALRASAASRRDDRDVADLAARARRLAVVVEVRARDREHRVAVGHARRCS